MNLDHFLDFWSRYNQTIIQTLIVVTLIFIVALVFINLLGSKSDESGGAQVGLSPELEKSLQKMLENQTKAAVFDFTKTQDGAPSSIATQPVSAEAAVQMEKLKAEVALKEKKIQDLNTQLSQAVSQSTTEVKADTSGLEARIKELEARLAEYDIISEDIADLSRYKEENEKIKAELTALRTGSAPAAASVQPVAAAPVQPVAPPPQPIVPVSPAPEAAPEMAAAQPAPVEAAPAPAAEADQSANAAIDDDLMKEFAAAVEGQKAATQTANVPTPNSDNEDLMGQFENFVQKKEGS